MSTAVNVPTVADADADTSAAPFEEDLLVIRETLFRTSSSRIGRFFARTWAEQTFPMQAFTSAVNSPLAAVGKIFNLLGILKL
jgi:hypothetical protein